MSDVGTKRKNWFYKGPTKRKQYVLEAGLQGFLCSCNFREKDCVRESYNLLNEYADKLYGKNASETDPDNESVDKSDEDIEDELLKETANLKSEQQTTKRFQVVESGAKNIVFIRTTLNNPVEIVDKIIEDLNETKQQKTRFLIRLVPIEATCKANVNEIKKCFESLLEKHFKDGPKTYSVFYNHRHNDQLSKDDVIKSVAEMVKNLRSDHTVNLKEAEISLIIEVIKNTALLSVVPNFIKFKKHNLHLISSTDNLTNEINTNMQDQSKQSSVNTDLST